MKMMLSGLAVVGATFAAYANASAELKVGFTCTNDGCTSKLNVIPQALHISLITESKQYAADVQGEITGPGVFILRNLDQECTCEVSIPTLNYKVACGDQDKLNVGLDIPEGKTAVSFTGDAKCFKILAEISNPLADVVALVAKSSVTMKSASLAESVGGALEASAQGIGSAPVEKTSHMGIPDHICDKENFGIQLMVAEMLPHTKYAREAQLLMSNFAEIFDNFKAGLVYYGGEGGCFKQVVDVGAFPSEVMDDFSAAMDFAKNSDVESPVGNPLGALQHLAEDGKWVEPAAGKNILRVALIEVSAHSSTKLDDCLTKDPAAIAGELAAQGISVIFFASEETVDEVTEFKEQNGIAGYVHVLRQGKTMLSVNALVRLLKSELAKLCGEGVYRRRLMFVD